MEQDIKQHTMVFGKGITSTPSDLLCDDDSLEVCDGMTLVDGEWKAIQKPKSVSVDITGELKLIHRGQNFHNYITINDVSTDDDIKYDLYYTAYPDGTPQKIGETIPYEINGVSSVGNTLIVNTSNGMYYYLWRGGEYDSLGNSIPMPGFWAGFSPDYDMYQSTVEIDGMDTKEWKDTKPTGLNINADSYSDFENACVGAYEEAKNKIAKDKKFCNPFFIRCALEMYDGTYVNATSPILVVPCLDGNLLYFNYTCKVNGKFEIDVWEFSGGTSYYTRPSAINVHVIANSLKIAQSTDYSNFSDLVKDIAVFITRPIERSKFKKVTASSTDNTYQYANIPKETIYNKEIAFFPISTGGDPYASASRKYLPSTDRNVEVYELRKSSDVINDLVSSSVFYKLCTIGVAKVSSKQVSEFVNDNILENIATQEVLNDGFYDKCSLIPESMHTFNRRLNITGVSRSFFDGFTKFSNLKYVVKNESVDEYQEDTNRGFDTYYVYIKIDTPSGERIVRTFIGMGKSEGEAFISKGWFYYPDTRAKEAYITTYANGAETLVASYTLKEHPRLNGAYSFEEIPKLSDLVFSASGSSPYGKDDIDKTPELLPNYVIQSEVDNPFTFLSSGYVRVGQGEIIGMAGLTTALSQDAYKVATTIVFTTQGIWALQIDSTGQYAQVTPPFSREVCKSAKSITMTDNAVFFVSEKGLMCVTGTTEAGVICVSSQLKNNKTFQTFLADCEIAYDYTESMLLLFKENTANGWAYNINDKVWSETKGLIGANKKYVGVVSDYPDNILQDEDGSIYSLVEEDYREDDNNTYSVSMVSRAMKFEGSLILKSIRQIKHLKMLNNGTLGFKIEATNDLLEPTQEGVDKWHELSSVKGKAWRFFRFKYTFTGIKATDSFIGTTVVTQTKHTDKVR